MRHTGKIPYCIHEGAFFMPRQFSRLAVASIDGDEPRDVLVGLDEILYFFTGAALTQGLIHISGTLAPNLRADRLYARTAKDIFLTHARTLAALQQRLDPRSFVTLQQSLLANIHKISDLDLRGKLKRVGFAVGGGTAKEWLTVSRRNLNVVRSCFGLPTHPNKQK